MSIRSEIERIKLNISSAYDAVLSKGGEIPENPSSDDLTAAINSIPKGEASTFLVKAPVGTIVIWSGSADNIPDGWHLCDGTDGTPNLKDKFILSAGSTYKVGSNGGAASRTLQASNIPTHNHNITLYYGTGTSVNTSTTNASGGVPEAKIGTNALTTTTSGIIGGPTNTTSSFSILPPYYALCYIMKITPDETDISADDVAFEPGETGLKATNIQEAIEEISKSGGGVSSFKGRTGVVEPQTGDYTAEMVGARPNTWTPTAEAVGAIPNTTVKSFSYGTSAPSSLATGAVFFVYE